MEAGISIGEVIGGGSGGSSIHQLVKIFATVVTVKYGKEEKEILQLYSSCRNEKTSFHLVCSGMAVSLQDCRSIALDTAALLHRVSPQYGKCIDQQVYSPKQCFRLLGSCKFTEMNTQNVKRLYCTMTLLGQKRLQPVNVDPGDHESLLQSLISCVEDCLFWTADDGIVQETAPEVRRKLDMVAASDP